MAWRAKPGVADTGTRTPTMLIAIAYAKKDFFCCMLLSIHIAQPDYADR
jgi:hypothetical protein